MIVVIVSIRRWAVSQAAQFEFSHQAGLPHPALGGKQRMDAVADAFRQRGQFDVNAIRYVLRTGCSWRMLPHDLPPWRIVFHYFRTWRRDGTWQRVHGVLHAELRQAQGRQASPSAAIIDSQSVKTTEKGGPEATTPARR